MINVLLVEESAAVAEVFRKMLESDVGVKVAGVASNGEQAIALAERLSVDLITIDLRAPANDDIAAIGRIMATNPTPIVVLTPRPRKGEGRNAALDAMRAGALAVLEKPDPAGGQKLQDISEALISQVKLMSKVRFDRPRTVEINPPPARASVQREPRIIELVAIAASTGGPQALFQVLGEFPADFPCPILLVQHIGEGFLQDFADWLDGTCQLRVTLASAGEELTRGTVYVAPEKLHLGVTKDRKILLSGSPPVDGHRPSATFLFRSLSQAVPSVSLGVLLTGMGEDGAKGLVDLKSRGGLTFVQDSRSSVVFGMPQVAIERGGATRIIGLEHMAACILEVVSHGRTKNTGC